MKVSGFMNQNMLYNMISKYLHVTLKWIKTCSIKKNMMFSKVPQCDLEMTLTLFNRVFVVNTCTHWPYFVLVTPLVSHLSGQQNFNIIYSLKQGTCLYTLEACQLMVGTDQFLFKPWFSFWTRIENLSLWLTISACNVQKEQPFFLWSYEEVGQKNLR